MINLTREEAQQVLDALELLQTDIEWQFKSPTRAMLRKIEKTFRAKLSEPEPELVDDKELMRRVIALLPEVAVKAIEEPIGKKKEWQSLTEAEKTDIAIACGALSVDWLNLASAIEIKLKAKNGF